LRRAERLVIAQVPWVFLYHPVTYYVIDPRLQGFRLHPFRPPRYQTAKLVEPRRE
jgi:hypothetical protein